jgi:hypothetical protein
MPGGAFPDENLDGRVPARTRLVEDCDEDDDDWGGASFGGTKSGNPS